MLRALTWQWHTTKITVSLDSVGHSDTMIHEDDLFEDGAVLISQTLKSEWNRLQNPKNSKPRLGPGEPNKSDKQVY